MKKSTKGLMSALLLFAMCGTGCGDNNTSSSSSETKPSSTTSQVSTTKPSSSSVTPSTPTSSSSEAVLAVETDLLAEVKDGGDGVYEVTNADGKTTVAFNKTDMDLHAWSAAKVDLTNLAHKGQMRTLKFKISGQGTLIIKLQGDKGAYEIKFSLTSAVAAYEFNLTNMGEYDERMAEVNTLLFFAQPGSLGTGTFVLDELTITPEFGGTEGYTIINDGWTNIVAGSNLYDGVSPTFSFNRNWTDNDGTVHSFEYLDDKTVVTYTKSDTYQFAYTEVSGEYGKFEYINFRVQGAAGDSVLFKVEGGGKAKETIIHFDGSVQTHTLDLTEFTQVERQGFNKVLMFAAPGNAEATGTFTVEDAYYAHTWDGSNRVYPTNEYNGTDTQFGCNAYWHDNGDNVYTTEGEGPVVVTYTNAGQWSSMKTKVSGKLGNFKTLKFGVKVDEGKTIMIKAANGCEVTVTGTGSYDDSYSLDLTTLTVEQRNAITEILIFAEPGVAGVSGTFEIHWMSFQDFEAQAYVPPVNEYNGTDNQFGCNANWHDAGDGVYTTEGEGPVVVTYTNAGEWSALRTKVSGLLGNFKTLKFGVKVDEGKTIMIKAANGCEVTVTGTGSYDDSYSLDLTTLSVEQRNAITEILIFAEPGVAGVSGTFEIHWMAFQDFEAQNLENVNVYNGTDNSFGCNKYWRDGGDGVYATEGEGPVVVTYTNAGEWSSLKTSVMGKFEGFTKIKFGVKVDLGKTIMVKAANGCEVTVTGTGEYDGTCELDLTTLTAEQRNAITEILIFAEPGVAGVSGTFEIHWMSFEK